MLNQRNSYIYLCQIDASVVGTGRGRWPVGDRTSVVLRFVKGSSGGGGIHGVE